jgi:histidinol-phosphate phosphatase family protein
MSGDRNGVVWLDRDGTIVNDPGYLSDPAALELLPDAARAVAALNAAGARVVLVTNQSGIARGLMTRATVDAIHDELRRQLRVEGATLDGVYLCPHLPAELVPRGVTPCRCRKPGVALVERARQELGLRGEPEVVVGDKLTDVRMARTLGVPAVLVRTGCGADSVREIESATTDPSPALPDLVAADLLAAVPWILERLGLATPRGNC